MTRRDLYDDFGVAAFRGLLAPGDVDLVRRETVSYIETVAPSLAPGFVVREDDADDVRSLHWMNSHSEFFSALAEDERLRRAVGELVDWAPVPHYVELFAKPAVVGSRTAEHQEEPYLFLDPPEFLTLWIALDPVTADNGPVTFYAGSHTLGVLPHLYNDGKTLLAIEDLERLSGLETVSFEMEPGDATAHHPRTVHFSEPNASGTRRMGLGVVYRSERATMDERASEALVGVAWKGE